VIYIYSPSDSERLTFVLDFCFKSKGINYTVLSSKTEFIQFKGEKINYSVEIIDDCFQIKPAALLFETSFEYLYELTFKNNAWKINNELDTFSILFYMLSSYEDYLIKERDNHGRFSAKHSFLFKNNRLDKPNADLIIKQLWEDLGLDYSIVQSTFKNHITFDIDSAWAIKNKGVLRSIASDIKDVLKRKPVLDKFKVRFGKKQDPFDTYSIIKKTAKKHQVSCFFLLGDWGEFDKNIHWKHKSLELLVNDLKSFCNIGIHPSYSSYLNTRKVQNELIRLDTISHSKSTKSRQHFLKLEIPKSYQLLNSIGITDDYSMGFADAYGFRSGTSFCYPFFDLTINSITKLVIHPITYMDGTLNQYLGLSTDESIKVIQDLKREVKNVGGTFCPLWHNETIGEVGIWKGWRKVFESNFFN
jgi:hypothetical protein